MTTKTARPMPVPIRRQPPGRTPGKNCRIDLRIQADAKEIIQAAADLFGMSLSAFLLSTGLRVAKQQLAELEPNTLSDRDRDRFLRALDAPPAPNSKLKAAMRRFKR